ncbi:MAG: Rpn family recombination-promoting nuclease/putative transposase [Lachnospiraceae bacterium]|nr:Rpn family recombination-promoting nuclease/putative transposase [Candidatus Colinaster scatohippi]
MAEKKFYGMSNDYMFKAVMQENKAVLINLVAALMRIGEERIVSCEITNPIELGRNISSKDCILDIKLILNGDTIINIELQIENEGYWPERSLFYWSRAYDHLEEGENYGLLKPTYQIGIIDFSLFKDSEEFFSEYKILNTKTGRAYTDKLCIRVLDLTKINLAREGEEELVRWAKIFKSKTMDELRQVAGSKEVMQKMVVTLAKLSEEEKIRQQCEAREKNERDMLSSYAFGMEQGMEKGLELGIKQGIEQGIDQGKENAILDLVRDGIISVEVAAERLNKSVSELEQSL